jgi:hypothetical protein
MAKPVLYLDHDVHLYFVAALRRHSYEAHSTQEFGNQSLSDEEQLIFAANRGRFAMDFQLKPITEPGRRLVALAEEHPA